MFRSFLSRWPQWISRSAQHGRRVATTRRRPRVFVLEPLEERLAPVVGAFAVPPAVPRGGAFDGIVRITTPSGGLCTGSLLFTGRHILTAAHCVDADGDRAVDGPVTVTFEMGSDARPVNIALRMPANHITVHYAWHGVARIREGTDLALLRLTDQVAGFQLPTRHVVAPFGAQRYELFRDSTEVGQTFTLVGYGETGTGATGSTLPLGTKRAGQNTWSANANVVRDEVQAVAVQGNPTGGIFTLTFNGQTTAGIPHNASAAQVQAALEALPAINPGDVAVTRYPGPGVLWFVHFQGALGNRNVNPLVPDPSGLTGGTSPTVTVATRIEGASAAPQTGALTYDFDSGAAAQDALGLFYGLNHLGLGAQEAFSAPGDSGGPGLIGNRIASVTSDGSGFAGPPDVLSGTNESFGEVEVDPRVAAFAPWIDGLVAGSYNLVLDMNQQVLGLDGSTQDVTITARRNGANLELEVTAPDPAQSGVYYSAPVSRIASLTIRGSADHETIVVEGNLGLSQIRVVGRAGNDTLIGGDGTGTLRLSGGEGDDTLVGAAGLNFLYGGTGDDFLLGGPAGDNLYGEAGNDILYDVAGADYLYGGDGNDILYDEAGNSLLRGEAGDDILISAGGYGSLNGGAGNDVLLGSPGGNTMTGDDGDDYLEGSSGLDRLDGGPGHDVLSGGAADDLLWGRDGDDVLLGGSGDDQLDGADGDDALFGEDGHDALFGGPGFDYLDGGPGNNSCVAGEILVNCGDGAPGGGSDPGPDSAAWNDFQGSPKIPACPKRVEDEGRPASVLRHCEDDSFQFLAASKDRELVSPPRTLPRRSLRGEQGHEPGLEWFGSTLTGFPTVCLRDSGLRRPIASP